MTEAIRETFLDDLDAEPQAWHEHEWTVQQVQFCQEYLRTGNKIQSYRKAFADEIGETTINHTIHARVARMFAANPAIPEYIRYVRRTMAARLQVSKETVLAELSKLGFANMSDFVVLQSDGTPQFDLSGLTHEQSAAIQEMTIDTYVTRDDPDNPKDVRSVKVKLSPKIGALELLGKHLKLFTEVIETNADAQSLAEEIRRAREARKERRDGNGQDTSGNESDGGETD